MTRKKSIKCTSRKFNSCFIAVSFRGVSIDRQVSFSNQFILIMFKRVAFSREVSGLGRLRVTLRDLKSPEALYGRAHLYEEKTKYSETNCGLDLFKSRIERVSIKYFCLVAFIFCKIPAYL